MNYTIAPADPHNDRPLVEQLWSRNLPGLSSGRHAWLYSGGPAVGWTARTPDGRMIGATGLMQRTMKLFNETVPAGQAIDLNVDQDHRSLGPALALQRAVTSMAAQTGVRLIYALPNDRSEPVLRRVGYRAFGQLHRWAKPLQSEPFLRTRLQPSMLRKPVAAAIDVLLRLNSRETQNYLPRGFRIQTLEQFDPRFDTLWRVAATRLPIAGERTAAYLDWRFGRDPGAKHKILTLCDTRGELLAYAIYSTHDATVYLEDFLFFEIRDFDYLLAELLRQARRARAKAVITVYLGSPQVESVLESYGFWKRPGQWNALVYTNPAQPVRDQQRLENPANWHLTRADLDTDF